MSDYTAEQLVEICEQAVVNEDRWYNRDSDSAQRGVGMAWAYLKAGVPFKVLTNGTCATNDRTIWLEFYPKDFAYFDWSGTRGNETIYLPTAECLKANKDKDWY